MTKTTIEVTIQPQTDETFDTTPIAPLPSASTGQEPSSDTSDVSPAPLLRGQQRPTPIGPPIPNHPLAPLAGKYVDEPLWDDFQEAIRAYRQRVDQEEQEDNYTPAFPLPEQQSASLGDAPVLNHPRVPFAETCIDEQLWNDYQQAIQEYRQRMNEQEDDAE